MKQTNFRLFAVFFLSIALIAYEIAVMRTFAVGSWSNFGSMVISIALLGFGLAGTIITFLQKTIKKNPNRWLSFSALLLIPAIALSHILAQLVPFNPVMIIADPGQFLLIGTYYIIYSIPFFIGAIFIGVAFIALRSQIHKLYFWNMVGSGIGGFLILGCMYLFPPDYIILPILPVSLIAAILCFIRYNEKERRLWINPYKLVLSIIIFSLSIILILSFGKIRVSEYKPISYARKFPDTTLNHHSYSPKGEMFVYQSSFFHSAPGLSDNVAFYLEEMPKNAFKGLYIDGGGPIIIPRKLESYEEEYLDFLPTSAPYLINKNPRVLLVKLGGGTSIFTALYHNARNVKVIEPNNAIISLLKNDKVITDFNGNLLENPKVDVLHTEPRAYCATTKEKYDLLEISLIDSVGLSQTGGYSVDENYTYTVEAFEDYMNCLDTNGILSITVWNRLTPPRNVPKLIATVLRSLKNQKLDNPGDRVIIFNVLLSTATVLVKKSPFTEDEVNTVKRFCRKMSFEISYYPGMVKRNKDFNLILKEYTNQFTKKRIVLDSNRPDESHVPPTAENPELLQGDFYHFTMFWILDGRTSELFDEYIFNIKPATDNRPYYTAYLKPHTISFFLDELGEVSEEWGYLLLLGTLFQSIFFGILIIIIPLSARWRELFKGRKGTIGVIIYYACLGLGYMLIEIFLIQKLVFFLGDPIFSVSLVITSLLVLSGLGSLFSARFKEKRTSCVRIAVLGIVISLVFYMFGLSPVLRLTLGLPFYIKGFLSILFIAPSAFFMGIPFPSGLSSLSSNREKLLPWAWGMNGALSVTGSVIARLISISTGFLGVLFLAALLYISASFVYKANEAPDWKAKEKKNKKIISQIS